jgi:hypothetical protein
MVLLNLKPDNLVNGYLLYAGTSCFHVQVIKSGILEGTVELVAGTFNIIFHRIYILQVYISEDIHH